MQISVIVPFYQAERTIRRCLEALLAQDPTGHAYEILMVDNNATDRSAAIVAEYPGVKLLHEPSQGAYAARNRALTEARGAWIAFTDPDCVPRRSWLRELTLPFRVPDVQMVVGRPLLDVRSTAMATLQDYERAKDEFVFGGDEPLVYYGRNNNMAVRRSLFEELGPFDELRRGADVVLARRCVDAHGCRSVVYAPDAEVLHLEMGDLATYYRKVFTYGRSVTRSRARAAGGVIDRRGRWRVIQETRSKNGYSTARTLLLLALLGVEGCCWKLGSWAAREQEGGPG